MKVSILCFIECLFLVSATTLSPITRVVELLNGLSKSAEEEGKKEEDLYESYVCWGKSVVEQKTASNSAAEARIADLEQYISDLEAGRIELTDERAELEKDISTLLADLEEAKSLRTKEKADFEDASAEMHDAIDALHEALDVLGKATADHKEGVFLAVRSRMKQGAEEVARQRQNLQHAATLGERFLSKSDAMFLRRLLTGDVPKVDWKKLNRKATFKMSYKARSFKIQDVLKKMAETFTSNLADAKAKEMEAADQYQHLSQAKAEQLEAAREALTKSAVENGARGQTKDEATEELDALKSQVEADTEFIEETEESLKKKKEEWKVRSDLRAGELEAISKAIAILHSDDARDLFKRSFESQEKLFFLQEGRTSSKASSAAATIREVARTSGDNRLLPLVSLIEADPKVAKVAFSPILKMIEKLILTLNAEEADDLKIKEECEQGRMEDTRGAAVHSRTIDDMTEAVNKLEEEIKGLEKKIVEAEKKKAETAEELKKATELREEEKAEFLKSMKDDMAAAELVEMAKGVLEDFYKSNGLVFAQKSSAPEVVAGEAPPPPPPTWEGGYGGKTEETQGIVTMMEIIHEDIMKDLMKTKADENEAVVKYNEFKSQSLSEMKALTGEVEKMKGAIGAAEQTIEETKELRITQKGELDAVLTKIKDVAPNCEYFTVNYALRVSNRHIELDGLQKAKALLLGADFS
jgi:hypothetical protein